jgi:hypothetical protein
MHHMISTVSARQVFSHKLIVWASDHASFFACLQSRCHELWSRFLGTTFGSVDALTYNPKAVFRTFPFPAAFEANAHLQTAGEVYRAFRAQLMKERREGLTETYNRFHDPSDTSSATARLRELHHEMDQALLRAYGWSDMAETAEPELLNELSEDDYGYQGRLFWPAPFRDEVLTRLLALNVERAAAERAADIAPGRRAVQTDELEDVE